MHRTRLSAELCLLVLLIVGGKNACAQANEAVRERLSLDSDIESIRVQYGIATAGTAIIEDGHLVWSSYFGEENPGVPASKDTLFNVASITKTVTAELVMRLIEAKKLSLDERMAVYWVDPDLIEDERHHLLTPGIALSHKTGFLNWRYMDDQFKLRFVSDPGVKFGYSGEGYDYLARFLEKKFERGFDELVSEYVLTPLQMKNTSVSYQQWVVARLAKPVDANGKRHKPFCSGPDERWCSELGDWSAADDMVTTVEDYVVFLINVMQGNGLNDAVQANRLSIQTSTVDDAVLACPFSDKSKCPIDQGYGFGWEIFRFSDATIVSHGGSDWSERAMAYFDPDSRNGVVVFLNGPNEKSASALVDILEKLDPGSRIAPLYRGWIAAYEAKEATKTAN